MKDINWNDNDVASDELDALSDIYEVDLDLTYDFEPCPDCGCELSSKVIDGLGAVKFCSECNYWSE